MADAVKRAAYYAKLAEARTIERIRVANVSARLAAIA